MRGRPGLEPSRPQLFAVFYTHHHLDTRTLAIMLEDSYRNMNRVYRGPQYVTGLFRGGSWESHDATRAAYSLVLAVVRYNIDPLLSPVSCLPLGFPRTESRQDTSAQHFSIIWHSFTTMLHRSHATTPLPLRRCQVKMDPTSMQRHTRSCRVSCQIP